MRSVIYITAAFALTLFSLTGCKGYNKILKGSDFDAKYELAQKLFTEKKFTPASGILEECVIRFRGTARADESIYLLASCYYEMEDYVSASEYFKVIYKTYPASLYSEQSLFRSGKSLFMDTPDPRLDPSSTYGAIDELQFFIEKYPESEYRVEVDSMLYNMFDRLVEKELRSARLYYNLGNYMGNNYRSCIIVAQNALRDYPYTKYREELSILVLRAKHQMALESVLDKQQERLRDAVDEFYAFKNEFPESKYMKEADRILRSVSKKIVND